MYRSLDPYTLTKCAFSVPAKPVDCSSPLFCLLSSVGVDFIRREYKSLYFIKTATDLAKIHSIV